jgi:hypothetical protein
MADARLDAAWDHTSLLLCQTANINRDLKKRRRPFTPAEFHLHRLSKRPQRRKRQVSVERLTRDILAVDRQKRKGKG